MTHLAIPVILFISLALGCSHARSVGPAEETTPQTAASAKAEAPKAEATTSERKKPRAQHASNGDVPVASSPSALLEPGATRAIQERLARSGDLEGEPSGELDGPTRNALARFQSAHDLPATGTPDDATIKKLGLDPNNVFQTGRSTP